MELNYIDIQGHGILIDKLVGEIGSIRLEYVVPRLGNEYTRIYNSINGHTIIKWDESVNKGLHGFTHKIIFAEKELNLDGVPILPNWREWEVEQLSLNTDKSKCKHFRREHTKEEVYDSFNEGFIVGYNHNKAKYTEEQVKNLVASVTEFVSHHEPEEFDEWFEKKLKVLQKLPKYIVMESEKQMCACAFEQEKDICIYPNCLLPKLTTNSEGKQEGIIKEIIY